MYFVFLLAKAACKAAVMLIQLSSLQPQNKDIPASSAILPISMAFKIPPHFINLILKIPKGFSISHGKTDWVDFRDSSAQKVRRIVSG